MTTNNIRTQRGDRLARERARDEVVIRLPSLNRGDGIPRRADSCGGRQRAARAAGNNQNSHPKWITQAASGAHVVGCCRVMTPPDKRPGVGGLIPVGEPHAPPGAGILDRISAGEDLVELLIALFDAVRHAARHGRVARLDGRYTS